MCDKVSHRVGYRVLQCEAFVSALVVRIVKNHGE